MFMSWKSFTKYSKDVSFFEGKCGLKSIQSKSQQFRHFRMKLLKFTWEYKGWRLVKIELKKLETWTQQSRSKVTVVQLCYWHKNRKQSSVERGELSSRCTYVTSWFVHCQCSVDGESVSFSVSDSGTIRCMCGNKTSHGLHSAERRWEIVESSRLLLLAVLSAWRGLGEDRLGATHWKEEMVAE